MYWSLKLQDGDLVFDEFGRLDYVDYRDSIAQSATMRLNTIKGELFYNANYGIDDSYKRLKRLDKNISELELLIRNALIQDSKISNVFISNIEKIDKNQILVRLNLLLTDNTILELNHTF